MTERLWEAETKEKIISRTEYFCNRLRANKIKITPALSAAIEHIATLEAERDMIPEEQRMEVYNIRSRMSMSQSILDAPGHVPDPLADEATKGALAICKWQLSQGHLQAAISRMDAVTEAKQKMPKKVRKVFDW